MLFRSNAPRWTPISRRLAPGIGKRASCQQRRGFFAWPAPHRPKRLAFARMLGYVPTLKLQSCRGQTESGHFKRPGGLTPATRRVLTRSSQTTGRHRLGSERRVQGPGGDRSSRGRRKTLGIQGDIVRVSSGQQAICLCQNTLSFLHEDRKSTRLNSSHVSESRMPSSA